MIFPDLSPVLKIPIMSNLWYQKSDIVQSQFAYKFFFLLVNTEHYSHRSCLRFFVMLHVLQAKWLIPECARHMLRQLAKTYHRPALTKIDESPIQRIVVQSVTRLCTMHHKVHLHSAIHVEMPFIDCASNSVSPFS